MAHSFKARPPKFAASLGPRYAYDLGDHGQLRLTGLYSDNSGYAFEADHKYVQDSDSVPKLTGAAAIHAAPRTDGINLKFDF